MQAHKIGTLKQRTQAPSYILPHISHRQSPWCLVFPQPLQGSGLCFSSLGPQSALLQEGNRVSERASERAERKHLSECDASYSQQQAGELRQVRSALRPQSCADRSLCPVSVRTGRNSSRASLNKQSPEQSKPHTNHMTIDSDADTLRSLPLAYLQA